MALVSSMFTAISGMRNHQTMLDVISNNIANVNTVGYKAGRVMFRDLLSQTVSGASAANSLTNTGGINAVQMGMGVSVASIDTIQTQGTLQATGNVTDLALNGDGYFVTQAGNQTLYTRAGNFNFDSAGQLVDSSGGVVQGWMAQQSTATRTFVGMDQFGYPIYSNPNPLSALSVDSADPSKITSIRIDSGMTLQANETKNVALSGNLDAGATAANLVNSAGLAGTTTLKVWDGGDAAGLNPPSLYTYTVGQTTIDFPIVDSLGNTHTMKMTMTNLSGTQIPGAATGVTYANNTWSWTANTDSTDNTVHLALDNTTFYDPATYDPLQASASQVRASSSGLVSFNTNGSLNWVTYADRNAEHFGTDVTNALLPKPNDPTVPGGWANPAAAGTWQQIADADAWNGTTIGFEGATIPSLDVAGDSNIPIAPPATDTPYDNPAMGGVALQLQKCQIVLVYQNVQPSLPGVPPPPLGGTATPAGVSGVSAGQRVVCNNGAANATVAGINVGGETSNVIEDWYVQWFDIDWGRVSTITRADFDRSTEVAFNPLANTPDTMADDANRDGVHTGDAVAGHDFPWDPYVTSMKDGGRDGLTQDVTGEWQLIGGVMTYVPNFAAKLESQDGYQQGVLQSLQIDSKGMVVGGFSNGVSQSLAQLAVANFQNPAGLVRVGDTHFATTVNSGGPDIGTAQDDGRGTIVSGVLEQSNVDLTSELTNMIVAQRGFEVNARVVTTSDTILNTLINLGR